MPSPKSDSMIKQIRHYQKKLEKYAVTGENEKLLYCIHKLKYLPVTTNHLELTGVGKSVNCLRYREGKVGEKTRDLVQKWKEMVNLEEKKEREMKRQKKHENNEIVNMNQQSYSNEDDSEENDLQIEEVIDVTDDEDQIGYNPHTSEIDYLSIQKDNAVENSKYVPTDKGLLLQYSSLHGLPNGDAGDIERKEKHESKKNKTSKGHQTKSKHESRDRREKGKEKENYKDKNRSEQDSSRAGYSKSHLMSPSKSNSFHNISDPPQSISADISSSSSHRLIGEHDVHRTSLGISYKSHEKKKKKSNSKKELDSTNEPLGEISSHGKRYRSKKKSKRKSSEDDSGFDVALGNLMSPSKKKKKRKRNKEGTERHLQVNFLNINCGSLPVLPTLSDDEEIVSSHLMTDYRPLPASSSHLMTDYRPMPASSSHLMTDYRPLPASSSHLMTDYRPLPASSSHLMTDYRPLPASSSNLMTDYRPLPRVPHRQFTSEPFHSMANEETLNSMLSSKSSIKNRKLYTGKLSGFYSVPSLYVLCTKVLQENIDALEATGGVPYNLLKPVLERATPHQLQSLEDFNPYLLDDSDELWETFCRRSFKNKAREDMESWRDLFIRCIEENQEKMRTVTENLKKKYVTAAQPKRTTKLAYVDMSAKPPKKMAQVKFGMGPLAPTSIVKTDEDSTGATQKKPPKVVSRCDRPKLPAAKKPKVAPLMAKTRQLMKKVCRR